MNKNLTVSGTFQSPLTSLMGVSIGNLTTNAPLLSVVNVADTLTLSSASSTQSYMSFINTTYTSPSTNYVGLVGSNIRLYGAGGVDTYVNK